MRLWRRIDGAFVFSPVLGPSLEVAPAQVTPRQLRRGLVLADATLAVSEEVRRTITDPDELVNHPFVGQLGTHWTDPVDGTVDNDQSVY